MDMKQLYEDFKKYIDNLSDEDIKRALENAAKHASDDRTKCCIDHDIYGGVCDMCEFGEGWTR